MFASYFSEALLSTLIYLSVPLGQYLINHNTEQMYEILSVIMYVT